GGGTAGTGAARPGRHRRPGAQVPGAALRRPAAAHRHRARPRDGPEDDPFRRAHLRPRPRDGPGGARRDDRARPGRHDHARGHPRDGVRPARGQPRRVHGGRPDRRGGSAGGVLHQPGDRAGPRLPLKDPHPLMTPWLRKRKVTRMRLAATLVTLAALATSLTACGQSKADSIVDKAKNEKKLTIGIKIDQPGLGLRKPDGTYAGFDVDVARYIAKELGVPESGITFKEAQSANREPFIQQGQVDMVIATYSITDERKEKVSFAGPYLVTGQDILIRA